MPTTAPTPVSGPLAANLQMLGQLVRNRRAELGLSIADAACGEDVSAATLARLESGKPVSTESMCKVLADFGLTTLVLPKTDAIDALRALGHAVRWHSMTRACTPAMQRNAAPEPVLDRTTPTLLLDYDGTLHIGNALLDSDGQITLDSGRPPLEFAPLLAEILRPYPIVEIVLTTSPSEPATEFSGVSYVTDNAAESLRRNVDQLRPFLGKGTALITSNSLGHRWVHGAASVELPRGRPKCNEGQRSTPSYEKEPRLRAGCWIGIVTGFRPLVSDTEIAQLMAFEPVARIREEWLGAAPPFPRSGLQYELEFTRATDPAFDHCSGWIGCSPDRTAFIFYNRDLYLIPMEAVIQLEVERVLPAKGSGGSSLRVQCRCHDAGQQTKTLTICSANGADDLDELAATVSRAIAKPLVRLPHVYDR